MNATSTPSRARAEPTGAHAAADRASTGVEGLDEILGGGLTRNRVYLLEGTPGTGKTTFALQFLLEGVAARRARPLHHAVRDRRRSSRAVVALARLVARRHRRLRAGRRGEPRSGRRAVDPLPVRGRARRDDPQRHSRRSSASSRCGSSSTASPRCACSRRTRCATGARSSRSSSSSSSRSCTVLLLDDKTSEPGDLQLHSISHGVISLEQAIAASTAPSAGACASSRCAARSSSGGYHDFIIDTGRVARLPAPGRVRATARRSSSEQVGTGSSELDPLLGGGLTRGTSTLLHRPVGRRQVDDRRPLHARRRWSAASARRYFLFDEGLSTLLLRSRRLGMDVAAVRRERASCTSRQIDPAELSPGEFASLVVEAVEAGRRRVRRHRQPERATCSAMPEADASCSSSMHELLTFLNQRAVTTMLIVGQHGSWSATMRTDDRPQLPRRRGR